VFLVAGIEKISPVYSSVYWSGIMVLYNCFWYQNYGCTVQKYMLESTTGHHMICTMLHLPLDLTKDGSSDIYQQRAIERSEA
jgi:hypothetical protein